MPAPLQTALRLREWQPLLALLAVFAVVSYWNLGAYGMLVWDEAESACLGRSIARHQGYRISGSPHLLRPPVLPLSVAVALSAAGGESDTAAKLPSPLFAMLAIAIVYGAVWRVCGRGPAFLAAWSLAVAPELVSSAVTILSEPPFLAFHTAALVALFLGFRRNAAWFHIAWIAFALALFTSYAALLFVPTLALILVYEWFRNRGAMLRLLKTRDFWLAPLWTVPILAPWFYQQWALAGDALAGLKHAAADVPAYAARAMPAPFHWTSLPQAATWPVTLVGAAGLVHAVRSRRSLGVYASISALVFLSCRFLYGAEELRIVSSAALPLLAIGVGFAAKAWLDRLPGRGRSAYAAPAALLVASTALSVVTVTRSFRDGVAPGERSFLEAMAYLRANSDEETRVIGPNVAQIHWYSDRLAREIPATPEALVAALPLAHWVVITSFDQSQPDYARLLIEGIPPTDQLAGDVNIFRDGAFVTVLARADWIRRRLGAH